MLNKKTPHDSGKNKGFLWTIFHGQIPKWGIELLEVVFVVASLFLAIRSFFEVILVDTSQWYNPTGIASLIVAILSVGLYLDSRFPGGSGLSMTKRLIITGVVTFACCKLALSY